MKEYTVKWRIEQSDTKSCLYIYDNVTEYGEFNWEIWDYEESETSAKYFRDQLQLIPDGREIELHINSNGGSVKEGTAIYNLLKQKKSYKTGIVDGIAHSIAFLILQACDKRIMGLGTSALVHNMWMECYGNAAQLRKYADDLDVLSDSNRKVFMERANIKEDELKILMESETYLTPEKALEYGLIDEIAGNTNINSEEELKQIKEQMQSVRNELNRQQSFQDQLKKMQQREDKSNPIMEMFKNLEVGK